MLIAHFVIILEIVASTSAIFIEHQHAKNSRARRDLIYQNRIQNQLMKHQTSTNPFTSSKSGISPLWSSPKLILGCSPQSIDTTPLWILNFHSRLTIWHVCSDESTGRISSDGYDERAKKSKTKSKTTQSFEKNPWAQTSVYLLYVLQRWDISSSKLTEKFPELNFLLFQDHVMHAKSLWNLKIWFKKFKIPD